MSARVILNPYSNRWNASRRWEHAEAALRAAGVSFELARSEESGHIIELAERAARDGASPIIVAGGDGSIGETVNGLFRAAGSAQQPVGPLGILPLGTANDLAYNLGLPLDIDQAVQVIAKGQSRLLDVIKVNDSYFVNNSAIGLEPYITTIQTHIRYIKGILRYLVAALRGIWDRPTWQAHMTWDDGSYDGPISLVSVGNGARTGGLFFMTPHADPFDGKLTFMYAHRVSRLGMLALLPRTMKPGKGSFVELPDIHELHSTHLHVQLEQLSPAHTDGEIFLQQVQTLDYQTLPRRLRILLPGA